MAEPGYRYDARASRYRDASGRFIPEARVRAAVDAVADAARSEMRTLSERLLANRLSLAEWQAGMMDAAKRAHVAAGTAARGGVAQMSPADYGFLGSRVRADYALLRKFAADTASGAQPIDGRFPARAMLYGDAAVATYEVVRARDARNSGARMVERNVLAAGADHCAECPGLTARGWVPLGTLPPVGSRACRVRDRCRVVRKAAA